MDQGDAARSYGSYKIIRLYPETNAESRGGAGRHKHGALAESSTETGWSKSAYGKNSGRFIDRGGPG